ncbi:MAG TPA: multicopper oxidase domain-containing protein [Thermoanaerobaculia bacterium]|jgi:FtsP/CotA-like multicopper oxidase with cupredoxin domain|nr:multicopper oxidase domain-containing protein [Thermoanaerobaculia bacterium]
MMNEMNLTAQLRAAGRSLALFASLAGIGLAVLGSASRLNAQGGPSCSAAPAFTPIGEIKSQDQKLQAVIKVVNGNRTAPGFSKPIMLRYFDAYNPADPTQKWPLNPAEFSPGPTLRAEIGDVVNITMLNQVKVQDFGGTLDSGEEGRGTGCNQVTNGTDKNFYPGHDKFPNCFHASSSSNLHFHGTHVTPSTTGDNVLVTIRPNQKVTEDDVKDSFEQIFEHCALGHQPQKWEDLPQAWRDDQRKLLKEYDETAPYQGGHGLPPEQQLWPQNEKAIAQGVWPQFYSGSYPYCFQLPKYPQDDVRMGQAPGTHWYHSHKHGSTSLNLYNGLLGAFIITDNSPTGYDGKLQAFYQGKLEEKVLVLHQVATVLNLMSPAGGGAPQVLVNGQLAPRIEMKPGQIQLWRFVNATVHRSINATFSPTAQRLSRFQFKQTAQDGVQLAWQNYNTAPNTSVQMAPANRVDLLVKAPSSPGCYVLQDAALGPILNILVTGSAVNPKMDFPKQESDYPVLPDFLKDIDPATVRVRREINYDSVKLTDPPNVSTSRQFTIDGRQFEDQHIDQVMLLDTAEEWTIYNSDTGTGIAHPFHIHVNPFQVVEIFDPNTMTVPQKLTAPFVWWDTFAIPAGKAVDGKTVPGYIKMRSRFVDFTGQYVQHCHILAHEDRGMMQLLEVVSNKTVLKHH